jgi:acyl carrier protein
MLYPSEFVHLGIRRMSITTSLEAVASIIRSEVAYYARIEFSDTDDFVKDVHLHSDDLTEIALTVEKRLGVKLDRREYRKIHNVSTFAGAVYERLSAMRPRSG